MAATPMDREAILKAIAELPPDEQLQVAQQIMRHYLAEAELVQHAPDTSWMSWHTLAGMSLQSGQTPPTESEIAQWLDERRMKEAE
ncbi:MAG TPA: hypothetical protein VF040_10355 [Ktedonobacterales bacterium]